MKTLLMTLIALSALALMIPPATRAEDAATEENAVVQPPPESGGAAEAPCDAEERELQGIVRANKSVRVGTVNRGQLAEVNKEEGDEVQAGEVLARLKYDRAQIEIERAKISIVLAEVKQKQAALEMAYYTNEYNEMVKMGDAVRKDEVLKAEQNMRMAEINVKVADGEMKMAQEVLNYRQMELEETKILSPIKGIVTKKLVEVGEIYEVGDRLPMFEIIDLDTVKVFVYLPLDCVPKVRLGATVKVKVELSEKTLYEGEGRVVYLHPTIDAGSETLLAKIDVPNPKHEIKVGLRAAVTFIWPVEKESGGQE